LIKAGRRPLLSPREEMIVLRLADGLSVPDIATRFEVAEATERSRIRRVERKLNAKSQLHAVATALREHLI